MVVQKNFLDGSNINVTEQLGQMKVLEHIKDCSVSVYEATSQYFSSKMNVRRRQLAIDLNGSSYTVQSGAMQWTSGNVAIKTDIKGAGNFLGKMVASKVTGETAVKPVYSGTGTLVLEPTYKHILLVNVADWGGSIVLDDGLFLACDSNLQQKVVARSNISSALLGGEGLFNLSLVGDGVVALESSVPRAELIEVTLKDDVMKIDGNMAIAWSSTLNFSVEKSSKSLLGSAVSGEGLVNVYRGTGKILLAPTVPSIFGMPTGEPDAATATGSGTETGAGGMMSAALDLLDAFTD